MDVLFQTPKAGNTGVYRSQGNMVLFSSTLRRFKISEYAKFEQAIKAYLRGLGYGG
jgi:hypothetical protein